MNGSLIGVVLIASVLVMLMGWLWQRRHDNAGIVDAIWAFGMATSAVFYALSANGAVLPRTLVGLMGGLWGLRLGLHIVHRVRHEPEDGRYAQLRRHWRGSQFRFLLLFQTQALLIAGFSVPFWIAAHNPVGHWTPSLVAAIVTWLVSVIGESVADRQLAAHRAEPANRCRTCRSGLWRYSRHPNYFFEWLHWFAYVFLAAGLGPGWVVLSLLGPALMLATLCWVTGIPYTEAQALRSRGDDYRDYQRTTSRLIPWSPKR